MLLLALGPRYYFHEEVNRLPADVKHPPTGRRTASCFICLGPSGSVEISTRSAHRESSCATLLFLEQLVVLFLHALNQNYTRTCPNPFKVITVRYAKLILSPSYANPSKGLKSDYESTAFQTCRARGPLWLIGGIPLWVP